MQPNSNEGLFHSFRKQYSVSPEEMAILETRIAKGQSNRTNDDDDDADTYDATVTSSSHSRSGTSSSTKDNRSWIKGLEVLERRQKERGVADASIRTDMTPTMMTNDCGDSRASWTRRSRGTTYTAGENQSKTAEGDDEVTKITSTGTQEVSAAEPANFLGKMMQNLSLGISTSSSTPFSEGESGSGTEHKEVVNVMKNSACATSRNVGGSFDMIDFTDIKKYESTHESVSSSSEYIPGQVRYTTPDDLKKKFHSYFDMIKMAGQDQQPPAVSSDKDEPSVRTSKRRRKWSKRTAKVSRSIKRSKAKLVESMRVQIEKPVFGKLMRREREKAKDGHPDQTETIAAPMSERKKAITIRKFSRVSTNGLSALSLKRWTKNYSKVGNDIHSTGSLASATKASDNVERQHLHFKIAPLNRYLRAKSEKYKHRAYNVITHLRRQVEGASDGHKNCETPEILHLSVEDQEDDVFLAEEKEKDKEMEVGKDFSLEENMSITTSDSSGNIECLASPLLVADVFADQEEIETSVQIKADVPADNDSAKNDVETEILGTKETKDVPAQKLIDDLEGSQVEMSSEEKHAKEEEDIVVDAEDPEHGCPASLEEKNATERASWCEAGVTNSSSSKLPKTAARSMSECEKIAERAQDTLSNLEGGGNTGTKSAPQDGASVQGDLPSKEPPSSEGSHSGKDGSKNEEACSASNLKIIQGFNEVSDRVEVEKIKLSSTELDGSSLPAPESPKEYSERESSDHEDSVLKKSAHKSPLTVKGGIRKILKHANTRVKKHTSARMATAKTKNCPILSSDDKYATKTLTMRQRAPSLLQKSKKLISPSKPGSSQPLAAESMVAPVDPVSRAQTEVQPIPNVLPVQNAPGSQASPSVGSVSRGISSAIVATECNNVETAASTSSRPAEVTQPSEAKSIVDEAPLEISEEDNLPIIAEQQKERDRGQDESSAKETDLLTTEVSLRPEMTSAEEPFGGPSAEETNENCTINTQHDTSRCIFSGVSQLFSSVFHKNDAGAGVENDWVNRCADGFVSDDNYDDDEDSVTGDADSTQGSGLLNTMMKATHIPFIDDEAILKKSCSDDSSVSNPALMNQVLACNGLCADNLDIAESDISSVTTNSGGSFDSTIVDKHSGTAIVVGKKTARAALGTGTRRRKHEESSRLPSEWVEVPNVSHTSASNASHASHVSIKEEIQKKPKRGVKKKLLGLVKRKKRADKERYKKAIDPKQDESKEGVVQSSGVCAKPGVDPYDMISFLSEPSTSSRSWTNNSDVFSGVGSGSRKRRN